MRITDSGPSIGVNSVGPGPKLRTSCEQVAILAQVMAAWLVQIAVFFMLAALLPGLIDNEAELQQAQPPDAQGSRRVQTADPRLPNCPGFGAADVSRPPIPGTLVDMRVQS